MTVPVSEAVRDASSRLIISAGATRIGKNRKMRWPLLPHSSPIVDGKALAFIEPFFDTTPNPAVVGQLADYIELSCWGHLSDGWRYLSLAATGMLNASRGKSLHLSYYAELRAALAILSCSGIAVLNQTHFSITDTGNLHWFRGATHTKAWEALSAWATQPDNALKVINALSISSFLGVPWLEVCRSSASAVDIATHWLKDWSIDLTRFQDDRDARNEASYRPSLQGNSFLPLTRKEVDTVRLAVSASLHSESSGYTPVQAALVLDFCKKSADFRFGGVEAKYERFWRESRRWLTSQHRLELQEANELISYVRKAESSSAGILLSTASPQRTDAQAIFSRAFFMLHLASAICASHRNEINMISPGGEAKWPAEVMREIGSQAGLWPTGTANQDRGDLEAESEAAIEAIEGWNSDEWCPHSLWRENSLALVELTRVERIFLSLLATS